jgi:hypothetical protein
MHRAFCAALLVFFASLVHAQAQPAKPVRILFIGNSLTSTTDIPGRLGKLARVMGKDVEIGSVTVNGFSLEDHWGDGRALAAIRKGWDIVVLQQGTSAHPEGRAQLIEYSKRFNGEIRASGAKPALYMVWPLADRARDFPGVMESYRLAAKEVDGLLIPVGEAWLRVLSTEKRTRLYGDSIHPSSLGSDLAVLTIYFALFPAGHTEFTEAYITKIARALEIEDSRRFAFFDAATRAIDEPMSLK